MKPSLNAKKMLLSLAVLFHMFCVILAPNSQTYVGQMSEKIVGPYVSSLELASQWGFFAPDPGPPPVFIEYELVGAGGDSLRGGMWPEKKDPFWIRERQNRRISVARFIFASPDRLEKTLAPYFCKSNPDAQAVRLWKIVQGMANLHDVAQGKRTIHDAQGTERKYVTQYLCGGKT